MLCKANKENKFFDISRRGNVKSRGKIRKNINIFSLFAVHTIYSDLNPSFPALFKIMFLNGSLAKVKNGIKNRQNAIMMMMFIPA
jgi:hypothetical protein